MWLSENIHRDIAAGKAEVDSDGLNVRYFGVPGSADRAPTYETLYPISEHYVDTPQGRAYRPYQPTTRSNS